MVPHKNDGNLKFLGRIDHQVKIRGFRIELGEIEAHLSEHPGVRQMVVVAHQDTAGNKRLVAYVVPNSVGGDLLQNITPKTLRNFLQQKLPDYMVPSAFVLIDELPMTPNGKIDRRALPVPKLFQREEGNYIEPRTPLEARLAEIWSQHLGIDQVGIYDNFCEIGGDSLLTIQLISDLSKAFELELTLESFLQHTTIAGLAQTIESLSQAETITGSSNTLHTEAFLDFSIQPENTLSEPILDLFLTGATGFLGAFLLHELLLQTRADIYCLVRATTLEEGKTRIKGKLKRYQLWEENLSDRIIPVLGDLSKPLLGMKLPEFSRFAEKIDIIYHCGASVNMVYPYSALAATNVLGTHEVLRLASQCKIKPVHFMSTVDVLPSTNGDIGIVKQGDTISAGSATYLYSGYAQSKYIAEQLVKIAHSRGLPVSIYRPSNIMGHSKTGVCSTTAFVPRMINGCIQMGIAPELEAVLNFVPVDYVSQVIIHLSRQQKLCGEVFYIVNPEPIEWKQLVDWMKREGYPLQQVSYEAWYAKLLQVGANELGNPLAPLTSILANYNFTKKLLGTFDFDDETALTELNSNSLICPPVNDALLDTYFSYFMDSAYLRSSLSGNELSGLGLVSSRKLGNIDTARDYKHRTKNIDMAAS